MARFCVWALDADDTRNTSIELGGPDTLSQLDILALFEERLGRTFERSYLPAEVLERMHAEGQTPLEISLAGVMLNAARGGFVDCTEVASRSGIRLTPMREFVGTRPGVTGRVALVTGGARGIGEAIVRALRERGATVVAGDVAPGAGVVELDVRSAASFEAAVAHTLEQHGSLDILVNNAAVSIRRPFFEIDEAEWDEVMAVNLRGVFLGCRIVGRLMRERGSAASSTSRRSPGRPGASSTARTTRRRRRGSSRSRRSSRASSRRTA